MHRTYRVALHARPSRPPKPPDRVMQRVLRCIFENQGPLSGPFCVCASGHRSVRRCFCHLNIHASTRAVTLTILFVSFNHRVIGVRLVQLIDGQNAPDTAGNLVHIKVIILCDRLNLLENLPMTKSAECSFGI